MSRSRSEISSGGGDSSECGWTGAASVSSVDVSDGRSGHDECEDDSPPDAASPAAIGAADASAVGVSGGGGLVLKSFRIESKSEAKLFNI